MRQQAWDEVKFVLADFPKYDLYINELRFSNLYPYKQTDTNIGGGKGSLRGDGLERTVVRIADNIQLNRLVFQQEVTRGLLNESPEWVQEMIGFMHFDNTKRSLSEASELVGKSWKTAKKYYVEFMEELADRLGIYKG